MAVRRKPGHKVCSMCGQELPLDMFPTNRGMADGHLGKCFACWKLFTEPKTRIQLGKERHEKQMQDLERAEQRKEQRKEKLRKQARERYRKRTEEQRVRDNELKRKWRAENPDKHRKAVNRWRDKNYERYSEYQRKWREEHREEVLKYRIRTRERQLAKLQNKKSENPLQI